jgi:hypothetical protein
VNGLDAHVELGGDLGDFLEFGVGEARLLRDDHGEIPGFS